MSGFGPESRINAATHSEADVKPEDGVGFELGDDPSTTNEDETAPDLAKFEDPSNQLENARGEGVSSNSENSDLAQDSQEQSAGGEEETDLELSQAVFVAAIDAERTLRPVGSVETANKLEMIPALTTFSEWSEVIQAASKTVAVIDRIGLDDGKTTQGGWVTKLHMGAGNPIMREQSAVSINLDAFTSDMAQVPDIAPEKLSRIQNTATHSIQPSSPAIARQISTQLLLTLSQPDAGTTEIQLSPKELGTVRMTVTTNEGVLTVVVTAERAETNELMRRHASELSQELEKLGFESFDLSFGQDSPPRDDLGDDKNDRPARLSSEIIEAVPAPSLQDTAIPNVGLDIRV